MPTVHELASEQFYRFELPGRGWRVWPEPVQPEPPFRPFLGYAMPSAPPVDDGRKPTALSSLFGKLRDRLTPPPPELAPTEEPEVEPEPLTRSNLVELQTLLPRDFAPKHEAFADFLTHLDVCQEPVAFEFIATSDRITVQFTADRQDAPLVREQLIAHFPEAAFLPREGTLTAAWNANPDAETGIVEFGLAREFLLPLADGGSDALVGLTGALTEIAPGEIGLFQVLFQPVRHRWHDHTLRAITDRNGDSLFVNRPELLKAAQIKFSRPLFAVVVRAAARSEDIDRVWAILLRMAGALRSFAHPNGNELIPLVNDDYPLSAHENDVPRRQTHRSGMLLNADELLGFVHLPSKEVRTPKLSRVLTKTRAAPKRPQSEDGFLLGYNGHAGQTTEVRLTTEERVRHMHVIGASGTGKSTMLFNLIREDIENGEGVAVLDPHGDLVDRILGVIPLERLGDVVLVDPSDETHSVGFNILSAHSDLEKNLLASDLVSVFQRLSTSWGDQMGSVLSNAILAFLESSQGGTLADLRRFLIEPAFREKFLATVADPDIVYYWRKGFPQLSGNKSIGPVLTRLDTFLSPKPIRYMVSQKENRLDFADILDTGKIFLAKLPQGQMGKENAFLLGSLLVSKFQQLAMSRQAQRAESRRPFWLYVDEFQNFITPSMAEILSGARKYRLGLILAHQELRQLERDREVASAVLSNPYTRIVFRVGDADARTLEGGFANFEARDLQNLGTGEAVCRIEKAEGDFTLRVQLPEEPDAEAAERTRRAVIAASRKRYATPRADIETALRAKLDAEEAEPRPAKVKAAPTPVRGDVDPRAAEAPKVTVSEKEQAPVATLAVRAPEVAPARAKQDEEPKPAAPTPDLGRGGAQHKAIQKRVKEAAETLGFHSVIEQEVLDGKGSVDLLLIRDGQSIACEISLTTSIDHEVGNVAKCLKAGFQNVAVICLSEDRLEKIQAAVVGSLGAEATAGVSFFQPDQFITHLQTLPQQKPEAPGAPKIRKGYKVKHQVAKLTPEERQEREGAAIHSLKEAMQRRAKE